MSVELLSVYGTDLTVVNVAKVSYNKESTEVGEKEERLINFLAKHKHTSPFRHTSLQFRIECPIYVERQLFKHNVGISQNSISGRYVDFSDTYGTINNWRKQSSDSKQGSLELLRFDLQLMASSIEEDVIAFCKMAYEDLIELGVGKEQARTILPLNLNTKFVWTGTLLAFIHMCQLRLKDDAQAETREVVAEMLKQVKENKSFNLSLKAFNL
jgi:thymidylate synthase (FAD)